MITEIKIESILWDKLPINPSVLRLVDFIRSGGEIPPIHIQRSNKGGYKLKDGRHRVAAYKLLGIQTIKSRINEQRQTVLVRCNIGNNNYSMLNTNDLL